MNRLAYLIPRLVRRFGPARVVSRLDRGRPPIAAADAANALARALAPAGGTLDGARVAVFGASPEGLDDELAARGAIPIGRGATVGADVTASWDYLPHQTDVDAAIAELAAAAAPGGMQLHWVDLRDPFGAEPFEMLCYPEQVWTTWLDPGERHNRYRAGDYARAFGRRFETVDVEVLERDREALARVRSRVQAEFLTGDDEQDAITNILITAARRRPDV